MELQRIQVAVLHREGTKALPSGGIGIDWLALPLTSEDPEQAVALARALAPSCKALVLDLPDRGEGTHELLGFLAEETERGVVLAEHATRTRNTAEILAVVQCLPEEVTQPVVGLVGDHAKRLAPFLRAAGLGEAQVREVLPPQPAVLDASAVVTEGASEQRHDPDADSTDTPPSGTPIPNLSAPSADSPATTSADSPAKTSTDSPAKTSADSPAKTGAPTPAEAAMAAAAKAREAALAKEAASPSTPEVPADWPDDLNVLVLGPGVEEPPPGAAGGALRVRLYESDEGLILPHLIRAAADTASVPSVGAHGAVAQALAGLADDGDLPAADDPRLALAIAPAAASTIDPEGFGGPDYRRALARLRSPLRRALARAQETVKGATRKIVFLAGEDTRVLKAVRELADEGLLSPILLGDQFRVEARAKAEGVSLKGIRVVDPRRNKRRADYAVLLREALGPRRGISAAEAAERVAEPALFAACMLLTGDAHGILACGREEGLGSLEEAVDVLPRRINLRGVCGVHVVAGEDWALTVGDTCVDSDPTSEGLAATARETARLAGALLETEPRAALLSFTDYGADVDASLTRIHRARELARVKDSHLRLDGPLRPRIALDEAIQKERFPFCTLEGPANALVLADRSGALAVVGALEHFAQAEAVGPLVGGLVHPLAIAGPDADAEHVFLLATCAAVLAAELPAGRPTSGATPRPSDEAEVDLELTPKPPTGRLPGGAPRPTARRTKPAEADPK